MANFHDFDFEIKAIKDNGTFEGYGACFNNIDGHGEIIAAGSFSQSLQNHRQKGTWPAMLWQHRPDEPIGVYTDMAEDSKGLHVTGHLAMKTAKGAEAFEFLKIRAVSGLSIGFRTKAESRDTKTGGRIITEVDLFECSLVTFPANDSARVQSVKSIESIRHAEEVLRDSGFSRAEAVAFISRVKSLKQSDSVPDNKMGQLLAALTSRSIFAPKQPTFTKASHASRY